MLTDGIRVRKRHMNVYKEKQHLVMWLGAVLGIPASIKGFNNIF